MPLVVQMLSDFGSLMPLKKGVEKNSYKNEFYKDRFEKTYRFDRKKKT